MPSEDVKTREKLRRLLEALRVERIAWREKEDAILSEIDNLLGGEPGIGAVLRQLEDYFDQLWRVRYGPSSYVWTYQKDRAQMKRLIKALGVEELERRMVNYLRNADPYYAKAKHGFALFVGSINSHATPLNGKLERDGNAWDQVLDRLEMKITRWNFVQWFHDTTLDSDTPSGLVVRVPNEIFSEWILKHYASEMAEAVREVFGLDREVRFSIPADPVL